MPIPDAYAGIIEGLRIQTETGKIRWTEATKWAFLASFDNYTLRISDTGQEDATEFTLSILNAEGSTIDDVVLRTGESDFSTIRDLWYQARRNARGINEALKEIEQSLRSL